MTPSTPLQSHLEESKAAVASLLEGRDIQGAVVLGSGLGLFADTLENAVAINYEDIPYFARSTVPGHAGRLVIGELAPGFRIACMQGRFHYYEGYPMEKVVYPIRLLKQLGAKFLIVTNAAGGIHADFRPGDLMLIKDHINLMGDNPLKGGNFDFLGPRFLDMTEAYSHRLREMALDVAEKQGIELRRGIYAGLSGPTYETPAEIRMLRTLGADAVGMSTVPEVIAANHMSLEVLGISCISNAAAGLTSRKLSHQEVIETTEQAKPRFVNLLRGILHEWPLRYHPAGQPGLS